MPSPLIRYPNAVFGQAAGEPVGVGEVVGYYVASAAVVANTFVILDTANPGQIKAATASVDAHLVVGVAAEAAAAGDVVAVTVLGPAKVTKNTSVTAGDRLGPDATTAGYAATVTAATAVTQAKDIGQVVAIAQATSATTDVATIACFVQKY